MKKLIIAISSILLLTVSSAMSMEFRPSIGISGNMAVYAATGTEKNFNEAGTAVDTTVDEHGAFVAEYGSIFLEAALSDQISIGVDYVPQDFETPENVSQEDQANQRTVSAEFNDLLTVYAKVNIPLGGAYLKVGYSQAEVTSNENGSGGSRNSYGNDNTSGYTVGLGVRGDLPSNTFYKLEGTYTDYEAYADESSAGNKIDAETEVYSLKASVGYQF